MKREPNILLQRELRKFARGWWKSGFVWLVVLLAGIQLYVCANYSAITGISKSQENDLGLCLYFSAFHSLLLILLPIGAFRLTNRPTVAAQFQELLATPIPHSHIFWWLCARALAPVLVVVLALYLPLWLPYAWLYEVFLEMDSAKPELLGMGFCSVLLVGMLLAPWMPSKRLRRLGLLLAGVPLLVVLPLAWTHWHSVIDVPPDDTIFMGSSSRFFFPGWVIWHPLVTLAYFIITGGLSAGSGVYIGLGGARAGGPAIVGIVLLTLGLELLGVWLVFWAGGEQFMEMFDGFNILSGMLSFYGSSMGAAWLGLKWNGLFALSKIRIDPEKVSTRG